MKTVLVISSFVSASRVGATASAFCLRRLGVETVILPTTLMGRHPGWGTPGGGATDPDHLRDMWAAIRQQDITFDAVLSGYMGTKGHIALTRDIIHDVKGQNPTARIVVDPVMGDNGRLYVSNEIAEAITHELIPLADIVTPNLWELGCLVQDQDTPLRDQLTKAGNLAPMALITSVKNGEKIGAVLIENKTPHQVMHRRYESVPHGGGDALAATFLAHILSDRSPTEALERSVASIFAIMSAANALDAGELPLIREQESLLSTVPLKSWIL